MELTFMIIGFLMAAYSVVGNDVIQTLGTFLSSNQEKPWWLLWLYTGSILAGVLIYGWLMHGGDVSYGRLEKVGDLPSPFHWWYILPPLTLVFLTRFGIPVSTTFLVISVFSTKVLPDMILKSLSGYVLAFFFAILVYFFISKTLEKKFIHFQKSEKERKVWTLLQWLSTGFLWSQWLIQDLANIYVYLPRKLSFGHLALTLVALLGLQAFIFYSKGGSIQKVVTSKTNTQDIRSATIIDFLFGIILLVFKEYSKIPMSTTWVFIGLLAGRELMMNHQLQMKSLQNVIIIVRNDFLKIVLGLVVSVLLVVLIHSVINGQSISKLF